MADMEIDSASHVSTTPAPAYVQDPNTAPTAEPTIVINDLTGNPSPRESFANRDVMQVKVHQRKAERDNWTYIGRGYVLLEAAGPPKVVVRSATTNKLWVTFNENSEIVVERRGNFVVIGVVTSRRGVESWSLNSSTSSDTIKLLTSVEIATHKSTAATSDPRSHARMRRRVERVIKDDRRRRHRRRKETESMFDAFASATIDDHGPPSPPTGADARDEGEGDEGMGMRDGEL